MPADLGVNSWPGDMDCERHNGLCQWYVCIAYVSVGGILLTPASFDLWHGHTGNSSYSYVMQLLACPRALQRQCAMK